MYISELKPNYKQDMYEWPLAKLTYEYYLRSFTKAMSI